MKGLRSVPRVLKINKIEGRSLSLLFNNGYSKEVDIGALLTQDGPPEPGGLAERILSSDETFNSVAVLENTIGWPEIGFQTEDFDGNVLFVPYEIDPLILYNFGTLDAEFNISVGEKIRSLRKRMGLTQAELAGRVGTTKNYISKLENNKSDVELLTLKKIVEAGLNGKLRLEIEA